MLKPYENRSLLETKIEHFLIFVLLFSFFLLPAFVVAKNKQKKEEKEKIIGFEQPITKSEAMDLIFQSLANAPNLETAAKILRHLSLFADKRALSRLGTFFLDPLAGKEFKREVAKAIFELSEKGEYKPIVQLFHGDHYTIRRAVHVFYQLNDKHFVPSLAKCALDKRQQEADRVACLQVAAAIWNGEDDILPLKKINHLGADDILKKSFDGAGRTVGIKLIRLIALNKLTSLQKILIKNLKSADIQTAEESALALGQLGQNSALAALFDLFSQDRRSALQKAAMTAIYQIGSSYAELGIKRILEGQDNRAAINMLRAMQQVGCGRMLFFLKEERKSIKDKKRIGLLEGLLDDCQRLNNSGK